MTIDMKSILIIEDDMSFMTMLSKWLGRKGFDVHTATNLSAAKSSLEKNGRPDLILSDMRLPDGNGTDMLSFAQGIPLIIMTGYAEVQNAVEAMKRGARDYIAKPFAPDMLLSKINENISAAPANVAKQPEKKEAKSKLRYIEGVSSVAKELYNMVALVAPTPMSVLVRGANGTGKEYVARRIHELSRRSSGPFVAIDCGVLSKELSASELFGHVKGAFTGAVADKEGAFVRANGGTLFLDEMGNLSYEVQVQLLRAVQERKVRPVGGSKEIDVDVRLICATNADLEKQIADGTFREDLYHRINEFTLRVPSLRERSEDILLFAESFLEEANHDLEKNLKGFTDDGCSALLHYPWDGNLRQLRNTIKRAALMSFGNLISAADLALPAPATIQTLRLNDPADEERRIRSAIEATAGNKAKAARMLGIDRKTLYNKLRTLNIES